MDTPTQEPKTTTLSKLQLLKLRALQNSERLYKLIYPTTLQREFVLSSNRLPAPRQPWHEKRNDLTDFFAYGFNEGTYSLYTRKLHRLSEANSCQIQKLYKEQLSQRPQPWEKAMVIRDQLPIDYGGLDVPFNSTNNPTINMKVIENLFFPGHEEFDKFQDNDEFQHQYTNYTITDEILNEGQLFKEYGERYKDQLYLQLKEFQEEADEVFSGGVKVLLSCASKSKQQYQYRNQFSNNAPIPSYFVPQPFQQKNMIQQNNYLPPIAEVPLPLRTEYKNNRSSSKDSKKQDKNQRIRRSRLNSKGSTQLSKDIYSRDSSKEIRSKSVSRSRSRSTSSSHKHQQKKKKHQKEKKTKNSRKDKNEKKKDKKKGKKHHKHHGKHSNQEKESIQDQRKDDTFPSPKISSIVHKNQNGGSFQSLDEIVDEVQKSLNIVTQNSQTLSSDTPLDTFTQIKSHQPKQIELCLSDSVSQEQGIDFISGEYECPQQKDQPDNWNLLTKRRSVGWIGHIRDILQGNNAKRCKPNPQNGSLNLKDTKS